MPEASPGNICGLGLDIVSVPRFKKVLDRWGDRFKERLFTPAELRYCQIKRYPEMHLAARFAAKEAFLKALGTGLAGGISFHQIEINSAADAPPEITLHDKAFVIFITNNFARCLLSLSHTRDYATACVIITGEGIAEDEP